MTNDNDSVDQIGRKLVDLYMSGSGEDLVSTPPLPRLADELLEDEPLEERVAALLGDLEDGIAQWKQWDADGKRRPMENGEDDDRIGYKLVDLYLQPGGAGEEQLRDDLIEGITDWKQRNGVQ